MDQENASFQIFQLIWPGALAAQAISAVARIGVADAIGRSPESVSELAKTTGTKVESLYRLLRALSSVGVFTETESGHFAHTPASESLRRDHPQTTHHWAVFLGAHWIWNSMGELEKTVASGQSGFKRLFGEDIDLFMAQNPDQVEVYNNAMSSGSRMMIQALLEVYDFSRFECVVDIGGGQGELLKGILEAHSGLRGKLFDQPAVIASASVLTEGDVADRSEAIGGDFFESVPTGGDVYILKGVLHGFTDDDAVSILKKIRSAIRANGRLLIIEATPETSNEVNPRKAFMDLLMLTLTAGKERSEDEFRSLLIRGGFEFIQSRPTSATNAVVEAKPI
ncbi:MAG: Multifunctional cyclase-dehydratase-3-O-methyl transferase TcmN [Verrucomicrobia subdivision 3 bacterium]|nr:Multifunctional cyclase-dehydratase-3-O-methyl transferase TcmN [Limisphaerales bacterium]MCS1413726.1 Multifunctional cyclase-dehydratase-3-O-methyl transferase TcmN [Limisphaerales bacterium]